MTTREGSGGFTTGRTPLRTPKPGDTWRSRDPRDDGLHVTVLSITHDRVYIERFRRTYVALHRWHRDYEFVRSAP